MRQCGEEGEKGVSSKVSRSPYVTSEFRSKKGDGRIPDQRSRGRHYCTVTEPGTAGTPTPRFSRKGLGWRTRAFCLCFSGSHQTCGVLFRVPVKFPPINSLSTLTMTRRLSSSFVSEAAEANPDDTPQKSAGPRAFAAPTTALLSFNANSIRWNGIFDRSNVQDTPILNCSR